MDDDDAEISRLLLEFGVELPRVVDDENEDVADGWERWDSYRRPGYEGFDDE